MFFICKNNFIVKVFNFGYKLMVGKEIRILDILIMIFQRDYKGEFIC